MLQLSILIKENLLNVMNLDRIYLVLFASLYSVLNFHENNSRLIKINTFFQCALPRFFFLKGNL